MEKELFCENLFSLDQTIAKDLFSAKKYPFEVLNNIGNFIRENGKKLEDFKEIKENVFIHKDVKIHESSVIEGPAIICKNAELRVNSYIRKNVIIGEDTVVGNSTEVKNAILFNGVKAPHFSYIGDSILGYKSHLGAGVILSNVRLDNKNVRVFDKDSNEIASMRKIGSMIGDFAEIGCNSVLNPGTIVFKKAKIIPLSCIKGRVE